MSSTLSIPFDIPDVMILKSEITSNEQLHIYIRSKLETAICGLCKNVIGCSEGYGDEIKLRHLSVLNKETYVIYRPKIGKCKQCLTQPKTTQVVSWHKQRSPHTQAYDEYLLKQLINSTIEDVSEKENIGYDAVVGALNRQVEPSINWDEIDNLHTIGIDEIALTKGHKNFAAIITTKQVKGKIRILAVLADRKKNGK